MRDDDAVTALAALAQTDRLAAFRLLIKAGADGLPSGEIGERLQVPPTRISFHLTTLERAGLVRRRKVGRQVFYAIAFEQVAEVLDFLTEDCCAGDPRLCQLSSKDTHPNL